MRSQTLFGRIAESTNEQWFGFALVLLRITFGLHSFVLGRALFALSRTGLIAPNQPFTPMFHALLERPGIAALAGIALMVTGIFCIIGLCLRPSGLLWIVLVVLGDIFFLPGDVVQGMFTTHAGVIAFSLLALAGGLGQAFGVNGIVLRNIGRPGVLARALFG